MKKIIIAISVLLGACASKNKVDEIDVSLSKKVSLSSDQMIGLNNKGEPILQKQSRVSDNLRNIIWQNNEDERELSSLKHSLKRCRYEMADPRLEGNGQVAPLPSIDGMKDPTEVRERMGLIDDELVVVTEEHLQERLKSEKKYSKTLDQMINQLRDLKENCEFKLGFQRTKKGLPATRYQGQITVTPDGKVGEVLQKHEHNLDDAFAIKKEKEGKVEKQPERVPAQAEEYENEQ